MDSCPPGITHFAPSHPAWATPLAHPPSAPVQPAFAAAPGTAAPPLAGVPPQLTAASGYESDRSGPSNASSLTNRSTRTIEECEHLIVQLEAAVDKSTRDKAESESARIAAVMDRDTLKLALGENEALLKATQASVEALSLSNKTTEARLAAMERLMVKLATQSGVEEPGLPSDAQIHLPPQIQRTEVDQALLDAEDEDNPMFTPNRSNVHKTTVVAGPDGRHALSPSMGPPHKMSKPAERLDNGDSSMLGASQEEQRNIHHKGGGHLALPTQAQNLQTQLGVPGTSGEEEAEKC